MKKVSILVGIIFQNLSKLSFPSKNNGGKVRTKKIMTNVILINNTN